MKGMILAAGRGERMGVLTENLPKPLLKVGGRYLIEHAISSLKNAGINEIVINISWQAEKIRAALGNGEKYGVKIIYSEEPERLEVGGGIFNALPLLGDQPFLVMSSDVITDYPLHQLPKSPQGLAHIVMVDNPYYHSRGDYGLDNGKVILNASHVLTYASFGIFRPELFAGCTPSHFRLTVILNPAIQANKISGEHYQGSWHNITSQEDIRLFAVTPENAPGSASIPPTPQKFS